jgi:phosphoketolase
MPDTTETRDGRITETITFKFDDEAQQKRFHERLKVGDEKICILEREIERLSKELREAREALNRIANVHGEDEPSIMWPWAQEIARSVLSPKPAETER